MKKFIIAIILGVVSLGSILILAVVVSYHQLTKPVKPDNKQVVQFAIPKGQTVGQIAQRLQKKDLIKNELAFKFVVYRQNRAEKIQAGSFELSSSMSLFEIITKLTQGTNDIWATIPEGLRREEIAESLAKYELEVYDQQVFLNQTVGLEGRLFPDTYLLPKMIETQSIVNLLSQTFEDKIAPLGDQINALDYSLDEVLTMASLVEREARGLSQMKTVSGILWRRLEIGMPLQVDATLQYAKGYNDETQKWWSAPSRIDKKIESPFNTYLNPGLPPRPICNPGLEAIQAAINPTATSYLYYLHDNQGSIHYARTLEEHNSNINLYLR